MDCYCEHMRATEQGRATLAADGVPDGYCGICGGVDEQGCGKPGHVRPYPGPVPCTGCWCDECYEREGQLYQEENREEEPEEVEPVQKPVPERAGFWADVRWQLKNCWTNPAWYIMLALFVYGPIINIKGWNPLEWDWWIPYAILGPVFWMTIAVLHRRTQDDMLARINK
jgi:hypothetical protein